MKPRKQSVIAALGIALVIALFSSWVLIEIVLFFVVIQFARRGVIWPKLDLPENTVWFGLFWGLLVGILGYPLWFQSGFSNLIPKLFGLV
ncbi:hypothetical protein [Neptunomonas sp.]|uniref:hypothetical protein n=1 Tax=Neptunomonas sp. TaxID=1971898 RepID=UPI0025CCDDCB|nr:hypothetical protein [Neptunomonas sp.]